MRSVDMLNVISGIVVVGFCVFLIGMAVLIVLRPSIAERFLRSFATSAVVHYAEQALRLLVGASLVNFASSMWCPDVFWFFGWTIIVSTAGLLVIPWRWHRTFASQVMPPVYRHLKLFALGAFLLGAFTLYGSTHALSQLPTQDEQLAN